MESGKFIINSGQVTGQCVGDNQQVTMSFGDEPVMNVSQHNQASFSGRPAIAVQHLDSMEGTYVQCRLPNGDEAYVPLKEIFVMFERKMIDNIEYKGYAL